MARPVVIGEAISPQTYSVVDPSSFAMVDRSEAIFYAEGQAAFVGAVPLEHLRLHRVNHQAALPRADPSALSP